MIFRDSDETIPVPTNKDIVIDELNREIDYIETQRRRNTLAGTTASLLSAVLLATL